MKRKREQERDEAIAREQADARREALLAELRARETAVREPEPAPPEPAPAEPAEAEPAADADTEERAPEGPVSDETP